MTIKKFQKLTHYWVKELRLQDYEIEVEFNPELEEDSHLGCCEVHQTLKYVKLEFLPLNHPSWKEDVRPHSEEEILVHELLHIHLWPITHAHEEGDITYNIWEEMAINMIAPVLVKLRNK